MKHAASSRKRRRADTRSNARPALPPVQVDAYGGGEVLEQSDQPTLGSAVALDISLGLLDRTMSGKLLHVAQAAAGLEHQPSGVGHESSPPRMRRTPLVAELTVKPGEPVDDPGIRRFPS